MNRDVHLLVQGALLERLLEKALAEGAVFARVRRIDERSMRIETDVRSADTLIRLCRRYSLNCRTLRRGGRTALWDLACRRWTVLPGTALCFVICALFLSRVWLVDIRFTNAQINPDIQRRIAACLEENGIRPGMAASAVDTSHLQTQITASVETLSYAGVRLQGIRLLVETSPEVPAPKLYSLSDVRNLYAVRNGVVESVTVYSGDACVQPGDTVLAGEVLIRGMRAPIAGLVCMDQLMVDVTDVPGVCAGDEVMFLGGDIGINEYAGWGRLNRNEALGRFGRRVTRVYRWKGQNFFSNDILRLLDHGKS